MRFSTPLNPAQEIVQALCERWTNNTHNNMQLNMCHTTWAYLSRSLLCVKSSAKPGFSCMMYEIPCVVPQNTLKVPLAAGKSSPPEARSGAARADICIISDVYGPCPVCSRSNTTNNTSSNIVSCAGVFKALFLLILPAFDV